jgi:cell wall-associated NlpC family hydrolase
MAGERVADVVGEALAGAAGGAAKAGAAGAVAGAAKGLAGSERGRRWLLVALAVLFLCSPAGIVVAVLALSGLMAGETQAVEAESYTLAEQAGTPAGDLDALQTAAAQAGAPWQVLWALWYYESGPGAGWGVWPGGCSQPAPPLPGAAPLACPSMPAYPGEPAPTTTTTRPPPTTAATTTGKGARGRREAATTTTTVPRVTATTVPPVVYLGPFKVRGGAVAPSIADGYAAAAAWLAQLFATTLATEPGWSDGLDLASGIVVSQDTPVPYASLTSVDAETVRADMEAAIGSLPVGGNSGPDKALFDQNVFELAQATYLDWQLGGGSPSPAGGMVCGATGPGGALTVQGPDGVPVSLVPGQLSNAAVIAHVGQGLGVPAEGLVIAIGTALTESGLWDLPNPLVPGSETSPYVQWGSYSPTNPPQNGTSVGLFQQQDNWGPVEQRMDPAMAARAFYAGVPGGPGGLLQVPGWQSMPPGVAAQAVQASAFPDRYQGWMPAAQAVLGAAEGISCTPAGGPPSLSGASPSAQTVIKAAEAWIGRAPYVWGGGDATGPTLGLSGTGAVAPPAAVGRAGFDCSGLVVYAYAQVGVVLPHYSGAGGQFTIVQDAGGFTTDMARLQPGDLVFFNGSDGTAADPGHVGIYLGNYEMVDALGTGTYVEVDYIGPGSGFWASFDGGGPA